MNEQLFQLILTLISIIGTILTMYIIPLIKEKTGNEKLVKYNEWAKYAVKCAEIIFKEHGMGENKKEYVINFLDNMFNKKKVVITKEQLNVLIEAAVSQMNMAEKS